LLRNANKATGLFLNASNNPLDVLSLTSNLDNHSNDLIIFSIFVTTALSQALEIASSYILTI
jgi:hypothetical protein